LTIPLHTVSKGHKRRDRSDNWETREGRGERKRIKLEASNWGRVKDSLKNEEIWVTGREISQEVDLSGAASRETARNISKTRKSG
jgi:hypothetical protein